MSGVISEFSLTVDQLRDYEFVVKFDKPTVADLTTDEGPPLGKDAGPSPVRLLAAAVGNCLAASLLFACRKAGVPVAPIHAGVKVRIARNENRRLRVDRIQVTLDPGIAGEFLDQARGPRSVFEDFCTVTQSIRDGVPVDVIVKGIDGE
ncbi:MAG: OsmC family protein [Bryobacterales bacterium]|nr:OsmC family protein [Bryobacterales bacterium]